MSKRRSEVAIPILGVERLIIFILYTHRSTPDSKHARREDELTIHPPGYQVKLALRLSGMCASREVKRLVNLTSACLMEAAVR